MALSQSSPEEWEPHESIDTGIRFCAHIIGALGKDAVVIKDTFNRDVFVVSLRDHSIQKVVARGNPHDIFRCDSMKDGRIVCGTRDGHIVLYSPEWTPLEAIFKDQNMKSCMLVASTREGLILAAAHGGYNVLIINPHDPLQGLLCIRGHSERPIHQLCALSGGHIAILSKDRPTGNKNCYVIGESGTIVSISHFHQGDVYGIAVNQLQNLIHVLSRHHQTKNCTTSGMAVDVRSFCGSVIERRLLFVEGMEYPATFAIPDNSRIVVFNNADSKLHVFSRKSRETADDVLHPK